MTKILLIDASTEACSVALLNGDESIDRYQLAPRQHASLLLPMVDQLLAESQLSLSQLDAIACNLGPGAFTGIRIAVSVAQGLAYASDLPTIGLSTLANLASLGYSRSGQTNWLCAIDARMNEIYYASYSLDSKQLPQVIDSEKVVSPEVVSFAQLENMGLLKDAGLIGSGWRAYEQTLFNKGIKVEQLQDDCYPSALYGLQQARQMFLQNAVLPAEALQPVYLRNNVAVKKSAQKGNK